MSRATYLLKKLYESVPIYEMHKSITPRRLMSAAKKGNVGICVNCGKSTKGVEPDARGYDCPHCKTKGVYGAEELMMGAA